MKEFKLALMVTISAFLLLFIVSYIIYVVNVETIEYLDGVCGEYNWRVYIHNSTVICDTYDGYGQYNGSCIAPINYNQVVGWVYLQTVSVGELWREVLNKGVVV